MTTGGRGFAAAALGALLLAATAGPATAQVLPAPATGSPNAVTVPEDLAPGAVESFVAPLTDGETRTLLLHTLREQASAAAATRAGDADADFLGAMARRSDALAERLAATREAVADVGAHLARAFNALTDYEGMPVFGRATAVLVLVLLLGHGVERLGGMITSGLPARIGTLTATGFAARSGLLAIRLVLAVAGLLVFGATAYLATFAFFERFDPLRVYVTTVVVAVTITRLAGAAGQFLLAPRARGLRLFALDDDTALGLCHWLTFTVAVASFGFLGAGLLALLGLPVELHRLLRVTVGLLLVALVAALVWRARRVVREAIEPPAGVATRRRLAAQVLAQGWHLMVLGYVLLTWAVWSVNVLLGHVDAADTAASGLLLLVLLPVAARVVHALLAAAFGLEREPEAERRLRIEDTIGGIRNAVLGVLATAAIVVLLEAWTGAVTRLLASPVGRVVAQGLLDIGLSLLVAWIVWQMIRLAIDRHLPADEDAPAGVLDEDAQRAPASRAQTLLPLARRVALIVLVTMVVMITLSALGVDIGPLLAGAGVIGLAVGFGAQKLVQDMISGIFFLVDDAFRVGEYVEAGGMKGTVESISLRSMRLRHHLGPVQTIPYSEIQAVKNHSRDWVIMKLELRLPYETDVEKVRKIIKKVGQQMLEDEELGPSFLQPLKSQGVFRMEESALIVRMKFTALPNQQWVLRREAFRRVQQALLDAGIRFAHREVTVRVAGAEQAADPDAVARGAAATIASTAPAVPPADTETR